jgi:MFS family permease
MTNACTAPTVAPSSTGRTPVARRLPRSAGFVAMSAALLAFFVAAGAPTPLLPLYERQWGFAPDMLTIAFGVYAFAMIAALLVFGSLSDEIGRRPVLVGALALELLAMVVFLFSSSIGWLIAGRILQGIATGVASSTFGASIVELAPESRKKLGATMSSLATTAGLGLGALFSGAVALAIPGAAATTVWIVLVIVMAVGVVLAALTPETARPQSGTAVSWTPRLAVPARVRRLFAITAPAVVAVFLVTALFLGLLPTILGDVFHVGTPIVGGVIDFVFFSLAAAAAAATGGIRPHRLRLYGSVGTAAAAAVFVAALATHAVGLVWLAAVAGGLAMGAAFAASTRGLLPEVEPHERAGLLAAVFTVAYVTFGGSAIAAGYVAAAAGVATAATWFGILIVLVASASVVLSVRSPARRTLTAPRRTV